MKWTPTGCFVQPQESSTYDRIYIMITPQVWEIPIRNISALLVIEKGFIALTSHNRWIFYNSQPTAIDGKY